MWLSYKSALLLSDVPHLRDVAHLASVDSRLHGNDKFAVFWTYETASLFPIIYIGRPRSTPQIYAALNA